MFMLINKNIHILIIKTHMVFCVSKSLIQNEAERC